MNYSRQIRTLLAALAALFLTATLHAQVPALINYQGRVAVDGVNFDGAGQFKFALVNVDGSETFWSNDGTSFAGSEPAAAVPLTVAKGLYSVLLGDTSLGASMTDLPSTVFSNHDVRLRVWFDDGVNASQLLAPDQRLAPAAYVADGAINSSTIADGAIVAAKIAPAAINGTHVAAGSLDFNHLIVPAAPGAGQVLGFNGNGFSWTTGGGGGDSVFSLNPATNDAYYNGGKVGIGTSVPATAFEVNGMVRSTRIGVAPQYIELNGGDSGSIKLTAQSLATAEKILFIENLSGEATPGANNNMQFVLGTTAARSTKMTITKDGAVGIGTASPLAKLHVSHPTSVSHRIETTGGTNAFSLVEFVNANGGWNIGTSRNFNADQFFVARLGAPPLFAIQPNGDAFVAGTMSCKVLTIRGGADLAEPFQMKEDELDKGSVVVIDEEHPGRLKRSMSAYDTRVAGIISGANGINPGIALHQEGVVEGGQNVSLSGRVYVQADATAAPIKPGDLLTTSDTPGHAMKVTEHARAQGAVIGKAMSSLNEGTGMVLVLVTLQ
ncbi:MAG TPA: hypothetical protein VFD27_19075 [Chthoniobacteraceae bacterium]|nr:hypothetical protein [Chthoniobacteraceae bacterium]